MWSGRLCLLQRSGLLLTWFSTLLAGLTSFYADQPAILPEVSSSSGCACFVQALLDEQ